ncbi:MAG: sigma-54 dependent transcriptional regulator [Bacteroidales bacterium]|nr:sigma-54 dependent transcriptional regulator [Bacteroidales bacterium]
MILVIDDNSAVRASLKLLLEHSGHRVALAKSPDEAIEAVRSLPVRLAVMDMNYTNSTTGQEGLELLQRVKVLRPQMPVILITAWGSIPLAVDGMRLGAADFITKPWDNRLLLQRIDTALALAPDTDRTEGSDSDFDRCGIIGNSPQMQEIMATIKRIAPTEASVLIIGENGTGKELIAEAIHRNSRRSAQPFVKVNLGGISQSLFESEMFGHARGAYTGAVGERQGRFEAANGGTIFLDEIGDLDTSCQVKMLRVLQEHAFERLGETKTRRVDIRVVSATNANLPQMVRDRSFREDLFYRINLITIALPPLRERQSDIPLLVRHFAQRANPDASFSPAAIELLKSLPYPGNIRQLKNLVERAILLSPTPRIDTVDLKPLIAEVKQPTPPGPMESQERQAINEALERCHGNVGHAASMLGITRQTLYRRMEKFGLK